MRESDIHDLRQHNKQLASALRDLLHAFSLANDYENSIEESMQIRVRARKKAREALADRDY